MRLVRGDPEYLAAAALLAVHCAISFNDAVLVKLNGAAFRGQNHRQAAEITKRVCAAQNKDDRGLKQLFELVDSKNKVSYQDQLISRLTVEKYCTAAERFESWAEKIVKGLL